MKRGKLKWYSVLLMYPDYIAQDNPETYYAHVLAYSTEHAVEKARNLAAEANEAHFSYLGAEEFDRKKKDFTPELILRGRHYGVPFQGRRDSKHPRSNP